MALEPAAVLSAESRRQSPSAEKAQVRIPPPPSPPQRKAENAVYHLSREGREELAGLIHPRTPPYNSPIGDIKLTLDDLRSQVLDYYAKLYAVHGSTVSDKLDELAGSGDRDLETVGRSVLDRGRPTERSLQPRPATRHADVIFPPSEAMLKNATGERAGAGAKAGPKAGAELKDVIPVEVAPEVYAPGIPPHRLIAETGGRASAEQTDPFLNFHGTLRSALLTPTLSSQYPPPPSSPATLMQMSLQRAGLLQVPDPREHPILPTGDSTIQGVMGDLKRAAEGASRKLDHIGDRLWDCTENPDLRGWVHRGSAVPLIRRKPRTFASAPDELAYALEQLYSVTWRQVKFNERRIRAQRDRLDLLLRQCDARCGDDPRNGL